MTLPGIWDLCHAFPRSLQRNGYNGNGLCSGASIDSIITKILIEELFYPSFACTVKRGKTSAFLEFTVLNVFLGWGDPPLMVVPALSVIILGKC